MVKHNETIGEFSPSTKYIAVWFNTEPYTARDMIGLDRPLESSPVIYADSEDELARLIRESYESELSKPAFQGVYPDVISDRHGVIHDEIAKLYRRLCEDPNFNPDSMEYSGLRESLSDFWEREKGLWIPNGKTD
jgi:hypothetical protein